MCFPAVDAREEGGPGAASSEENAGEELQESGGAAGEGAGPLPADAAAAVPTGHAHSARLLPALPSLREFTKRGKNKSLWSWGIDFLDISSDLILVLPSSWKTLKS